MTTNRAVIVTAAAALLAGCSLDRDAASIPLPADGAAQLALAPPACDADGGGIELPDGFCALVAHPGVGSARHLAVAPNGDVYVALRDRQGQIGGIVGLRDGNGDGRLDREVRFGPGGGTGIAVQDGFLFFATNTAVLRYALDPAAGLEPGLGPDTVVAGFPEQRSHAAKTLAFDGEGRMWVNVGAPSNNCQEEDRRPGVPGRDPCPELERQAGVWVFAADRTGQRQEDGARWATGIRNALALAWEPSAGALFAVVHGRDMLDVIAPDDFTSRENAELPSEEFIRVERGADFGWPYCYHDPHRDRRVLAPEYGGDGSEVGRCAAYPAPLVAFPAHWAPQELLFYSGEHFPERYHGGAFIAWHGSWNRAPHPQRGYKVTFQPMRGGAPVGEWEAFADGFSGREVVANPNEAAHRPMGLALAPDGTLYVVDSVVGRIWRVVYTGR
jgi:glucose/arabinose dehydrogenase